MSRPLRLAHRGDFREAPENSLPALLAALRIPACDGLEFDVRPAADGTPVLVHDATLRRAYAVTGRVGRMHPVALAPVGIATLADVLAAIPDGTFLDIELKGPPAPAVIGVIEATRGPRLRDAVISSFRPDTVAMIRRERPGWPCWLNTHTLGPVTVARAVHLGCVGVGVDWRGLRERSIRRAQAAGLTVASFTIRDRALFDRLAGLGVAAMCVEGEALDG